MLTRKLARIDDPGIIEIRIEAGVDVDSRDEEGRTPLMRAARTNKDSKFIEMLLAAGAEVDATDSYSWTALVTAGAVVDAKDIPGRTALMHAAWLNPNLEIVGALLDLGADPRLRSYEDKTAFDHAQQNEHLKGTTEYWILNDARF